MFLLWFKMKRAEKAFRFQVLVSAANTQTQCRGTPRDRAGGALEGLWPGFSPGLQAHRSESTRTLGARVMDPYGWIQVCQRSPGSEDTRAGGAGRDLTGHGGGE